jgi:hypothetical protein
MAGPALVLVHGRSQQMPAASRKGPAEEIAFVEAKKRSWLAGLSKGLVLAGLPPIDDSAVYFPYYGNLFADAIAARERAGLPGPDLEIAAPVQAGAAAGTPAPGGGLPARPPSADTLILDAARLLGFTPEKEAPALAADLPLGDGTTTPGIVAAEQAWAGYPQGIAIGDLLKSRLLRAALSYLARKTGVPQLIIERFLTDVAYYLDVSDIRNLVLNTVEAGVRDAAAARGSVVLVTHSLGAIVGYDLFSRLADTVDIPLFVTAGSPLGYPVVERDLLPGPDPAMPRPGPALNGTQVPWLNAFDVQDFVALVHPLGNFYRGDLREERTLNPSDPHSIPDYLADPDVARPIGRALSGSAPW